MIIGLTGGPGAGKTLVADFLRENGAIVLSGDDAGREAVERVPSVLRRLVAVFGKSILKADGALDRKRLGQIVFADPPARWQLNEIVHPTLLRILKASLIRLRKSKSNRLVVIDAALILEWGIADWCDCILVITAKRDLRVRRMISDGLTRQEALGRIRSQMPDRQKAALADYVIENNGSRAALRKRVTAFLELLQRTGNSPGKKRS
jgi:dephospho-CoA kinase